MNGKPQVPDGYVPGTVLTGQWYTNAFGHTVSYHSTDLIPALPLPEEQSPRSLDNEQGTFDERLDRLQVIYACPHRQDEPAWQSTGVHRCLKKGKPVYEKDCEACVQAGENG